MKLTKTEKYISKSGKVMTTGKIINYARNVLRIDNIHKDVFELIDFATKSLQQENARLKEISWDWERKYFDLIKSTDKELKVLKQLMVLDHLRLKKLLKKQRR